MMLELLLMSKNIWGNPKKIKLKAEGLLGSKIKTIQITNLHTMTMTMIDMLLQTLSTILMTGWRRPPVKSAATAGPQTAGGVYSAGTNQNMGGGTSRNRNVNWRRNVPTLSYSALFARVKDLLLAWSVTKYFPKACVKVYLWFFHLYPSKKNETSHRLTSSFDIFWMDHPML